jgi:hypothetical protein
MESSVFPTGSFESVNMQPSGGAQVLESLGFEGQSAESSQSIPHHLLGVKPSGNQYTSLYNSKAFAGSFQLFPDDILAIFLEYLDSSTLRCLGSTCKFLYAFCRSDDLWKSLFIE